MTGTPTTTEETGQEPKPSKGQEPEPKDPASKQPAKGQEPEPSQEDTTEESKSKLTPEQLETELAKVRREAAQRRKREEALEKQLKEKEDAELSETERLKKQVAEYQKKDADKDKTLQERTISYEIRLASKDYGIVDTQAAELLIDRDLLEYDEDGKIEEKTLDKAMQKLVKDRPWLVGTATGGGSPTNPARPDGSKFFTRDQIADRKFWEANRDEIEKAIREGRITD